MARRPFQGANSRLALTIMAMAMSLLTGCVESADKKDARTFCKVLSKDSEAVRQATAEYNRVVEDIAQWSNGFEAKNPGPGQGQQLSQQARTLKDRIYPAGAALIKLRDELSAVNITTAFTQSVRDEINRKLNEAGRNSQEIGTMFFTAIDVYPNLPFGQYPTVVNQIGIRAPQSMLQPDIIPAAITKLREKYELTDKDIQP
jgi:hypothetical protein